MLIHRVAHPLVSCLDAERAVGPYNAASIATTRGLDPALVDGLREVADFLYNRLDSSHTPAPASEGHYIRAGREQSVFLSVEQAENWFQDGVELMQQHGFRWFTYEIQERYVRACRSQAIALLKRARLLSISDIPFQSQPDYYYCMWCGYSDGCPCWDTCVGCECINADCFCWNDDGIDDCGKCFLQPWSCAC